MGAPLGQPVDDATHARLRELVEQVGVRRAAEQLGVDRSVVLQALARQGIRRGSLVLLSQGLDSAEAR